MSTESWLESSLDERRLDERLFQVATDDGMVLPPDGQTSTVVAQLVSASDAIPPVVFLPAPLRSPREPAPSSLLGAVGYCGLLFAVEFAAIVMFAAMLIRNFGKSAIEMLQSDDHRVVMQALNGIVILALGIFLYRTKHDAPPRERMDVWRSLRHSLLLVVLMLPLFLTLQTAAEWIIRIAALDEIALPVASQGNKWVDVDSMSHVELTFYQLVQKPWSLVILIGCVMPAVSEEVFFRLFLGTGLVRRYRWAGGIIATSLLFAIMHWWPPQVCFALLMGIVLHAVYLLTRSLTAAILLHGLNNLFAFGIMKLANDGTFDITSSDGRLHVPVGLWWASLAASVSGLGLLYATRATLPRSESGSAADRANLGETTQPGFPTLTWYRGVFLATLTVWCFAGWSVGRTWIAQSYVNRAENDLIADDAASALHGLHNALHWDDQLASAYALRSWLHRDAERWELARKDCDKAIELDPSNLSGYRERCQLFQARKEWQAAVDDATKAIALAPRIPDLYCYRALSLNNLGEYQRAIDDCVSALKLLPDYAEPYRLRAYAYCEDGDYRRAVEDCDRALELAPDLASALGIRGRSRLHLGELSGALEDLQRCLNGDGEELLHVRLDLGKTLCELKRWDEAIVELSKVIEVETRYKAAIEWRAKAYRARGDAADAERDEQTVRELTVGEHIYLARKLIDESRWSAALEELSQAERIMPSHDLVFWLKAIAVHGKGDSKTALDHIDRAIQLSPETAEFWRLRAQFLLVIGNVAEAIRSLEQSIRLDPKDEWAPATLKALTRTGTEGQAAHPARE